MQDIDPSAPIVGEDGLEYKTLGHCICGVQIDCWRNDLIAKFHGPKGINVWKVYHERSRDGARFGDPSNAVLPQGLDFFDPAKRRPGCSPEGAGGPSPVQAPADPVHATD